MSGPDLPLGSVVTIGHPGNQRLAYRASDGWHEIRGTVAPLVPEDDWRNGWLEAGPARPAAAPSEQEDVRNSVRIMAQVLDELDRAVAKFPGQHLESGTGESVVWVPGKWATAREMANVLRARTNQASEDGTLTWLHVLLEELGEALAEEDPAKLRPELIQVAAMCVRWIIDLDAPQPVHFTAPSGRIWHEVGRDVDGRAVVQRMRCRYLRADPNEWGCYDPRCGDSTWDHACPTPQCATISHLVPVTP